MLKKSIFCFCLGISATYFSQNINFTDQNFKQFLVNVKVENKNAIDINGNYTTIDLNNDGEIQVSEAENIGSLFTSYNKTFNDINGIEFFKNLTYLNIDSAKNLTSVNLKNLSKLNFLSAQYLDNLESLSLSDCSNLEELRLVTPKLNSLNLSNNSLLKTLLILDSNIQSLNLSQNKNLSNVQISSPNLTTINLENLSLLTTLVIRENNLKDCHFSNAVNLKTLTISDASSFNTLDINNNLELQKVAIEKTNSSTEIKLPTNILSKLSTFRLSNSSISAIDFSKTLSLEDISILKSDNIKSIDISKNINLKYFVISDSPNINSLDSSKNINLEVINVFNMPNLESLYIKNGKKQSFGENFMGCPKLSYVCCDEEEKAFFENKGVPTVVTDCALATQEMTNLSNLKLFPNPTIDVINLNKKISEYQVFDTHGKIILIGKNTEKINVKSLAKGLYYLKAISSNKTETKSFIKQ